MGRRASATDPEPGTVDAFASTEKTLHANPGTHGQVPAFEIDSTLRFFARHLG